MNLKYAKHIIQQCLPKHLYMNSQTDIFHIDDPRFIMKHLIVTELNAHLKTMKAIGYISYVPHSQLGQMENDEDVLQIMRFFDISKWIKFHVFLQEVGGNVELYKELIQLTVGFKI